MFSQDGTLMVTLAQEGMLRLKEPGMPHPPAGA